MKLLQWDLYEIRSAASSLTGVMLRGRIRKLGLENGFNVLAENTEDMNNGVRFAVLDTESADKVIAYIKSIMDDVEVELIEKGVANPILSKLKVNIEARYTL